MATLNALTLINMYTC